MSTNNHVEIEISSGSSSDDESVYEIDKKSTDEEKQATRITHYFGKKRGRKRKNRRVVKRQKSGATVNLTLKTNCSATESISSSSSTAIKKLSTTIAQLSSSVNQLSTTVEKSASERQASKNQTKTNRIDWSSEAYFPLLVRTIEKKRRLGKLYDGPPIHLTGAFVPPSTLHNTLNRLQGKEPTLENCFPQKKTSLLSEHDVIVLQDIIRKRDQNNAGLGRKEAILIIMDLGRAKSFKASKNHLDCLIRAKRLKDLKQNRRIVTVQQTSTERCQISTAQQMRWHYLIENEWRYLRNVNQPLNVFKKEHKHCQLNLDEACFMCSDGILKILGDAHRPRHDKNTADNRVSVTSVRIGSAGGSNGPVVFLAVGNKGEGSVNKLFRNKRLEDVYGLPKGSCVLCNASAFMDDATRLEVVNQVAPAIRVMPVIRDHP